MPAAAVIPAPRAYIKVVAVKKLVVEPRGRSTVKKLSGLRFARGLGGRAFAFEFAMIKKPARRGSVSSKGGAGVRLVGSQSFTLNKLGCSKQTNTS